MTGASIENGLTEKYTIKVDANGVSLNNATNKFKGVKQISPNMEANETNLLAPLDRKKALAQLTKICADIITLNQLEELIKVNNSGLLITIKTDIEGKPLELEFYTKANSILTLKQLENIEKEILQNFKIKLASYTANVVKGSNFLTFDYKIYFVNVLKVKKNILDFDALVINSSTAASISALGAGYGYCDVETVDLTIGASLDNCVWTAVLISVKGNYSLQTRLVTGCSEVGGNTTSSNYCHQVFDLKNLGAGNQWYMLSAVIAHENVHASHLLPGLNDALASIEADVKTLTVPATGQTKAQAISQLRALAGFEDARTAAKGYWRSAYINLALDDHGTSENGPAYMAERAIVDPVGTFICNLKTSNPSWPACAYCP